MCIHMQTFHDTYQYYYMIAPVVLVCIGTCIWYVFVGIVVHFVQIHADTYHYNRRPQGGQLRAHKQAQGSTGASKSWRYWNYSSLHARVDVCKLSRGRVWQHRSAWDRKRLILHQFVGHGLSLWPSGRLKTKPRAQGCCKDRCRGALKVVWRNAWNQYVPKKSNTNKYISIQPS